MPRPPGLIAWGSIILVIGSLVGSVFLLSAALVTIESYSSGIWAARLANNLARTVSYGLWGAILIWTGVGCFRLRSWVAPLVFAESAVLALLHLTLVSSCLRILAYQHGLYFNPIILVELLLTYGVPGAACVYFSRPNVRRALAANHPDGRRLGPGEDLRFAWAVGCMLFGVTSVIDQINMHPYLIPLATVQMWLYVLLSMTGLLCYWQISIARVAAVLIVGSMALLQFAALLGIPTGILPTRSSIFSPVALPAGTRVYGNLAASRPIAYVWIDVAVGLLRMLMYWAALCVGVYTERAGRNLATAEPAIPISADAE